MAGVRARWLALSALLVLVLVGAAEACSSTSPAVTVVDSGTDDSPSPADDGGSVEAGCEAGAPLPKGDFEIPPPTGPYSIVRGVRRTMVDTTRSADGYTLDAGAGDAGGNTRALSVEVWFPAAPCLPGQTVPYLDPMEGSAFGFSGSQIAQVHTHAHAKAPFAAGLGARPLLIFSPGYGNIPRLYQGYFEELASHGYVVAGISNTFWAAVTTFADGSTFAATHTYDTSTAEDDQAVWLADARFVLGQMIQVGATDPEAELTGHLDPNEVGMFGHSFGGSTSLNVALVDGRVKGAVDLDGTVWGAAASTPIASPIFLFSHAAGFFDAIFSPATGTAFSAYLVGSEHMNFSDYAPVVVGLGLASQQPAGTLGKIDATRAIQVVNAYLLAFFDQQLGGQSSPLLAGPSPSYPEISQFQKKP